MGIWSALWFIFCALSDSLGVARARNSYFFYQETVANACWCLSIIWFSPQPLAYPVIYYL